MNNIAGRQDLLAGERGWIAGGRRAKSSPESARRCSRVRRCGACCCRRGVGARSAHRDPRGNPADRVRRHPVPAAGSQPAAERQAGAEEDVVPPCRTGAHLLPHNGGKASSSAGRVCERRADRVARTGLTPSRFSGRRRVAGRVRRPDLVRRWIDQRELNVRPLGPARPQGPGTETASRPAPRAAHRRRSRARARLRQALSRHGGRRAGAVRPRAKRMSIGL